MTTASVATSQMLSLIIGMTAVLAVIAAAAWLLKRVAPRAHGNSAALRVVSGIAVGQRERVVIVEVGATWLILGVAPGSVTTLHQMPRTPEVESHFSATDKPRRFAHWLKKTMEKRNVR